MKLLVQFFLILMFPVFISSCKGETSGNKEKIENTSLNEEQEIKLPTEIKDLKPEEMMFLIEGAVDSWFFYNLDNYASYEAIMRSTDYDSISDVHLHHVRYKFMNKEGGYQTDEKTFEVTFIVNEEGIPDFEVKEIPTAERKFTIDSWKK